MAMDSRMLRTRGSVEESLDWCQPAAHNVPGDVGGVVTGMRLVGTPEGIDVTGLDGAGDEEPVIGWRGGTPEAGDSVSACGAGGACGGCGCGCGCVDEDEAVRLMVPFTGDAGLAALAA
jgi:hypothetical protein